MRVYKWRWQRTLNLDTCDPLVFFIRAAVYLHQFWFLQTLAAIFIYPALLCSWNQSIPSIRTWWKRTWSILASGNLNELFESLVTKPLNAQSQQLACRLMLISYSLDILNFARHFGGWSGMNGWLSRLWRSVWELFKSNFGLCDRIGLAPITSDLESWRRGMIAGVWCNLSPPGLDDAVLSINESNRRVQFKFLEVVY